MTYLYFLHYRDYQNCNRAIYTFFNIYTMVRTILSIRKKENLVIDNYKKGALVKNEWVMYSFPL